MQSKSDPTLYLHISFIFCILFTHKHCNINDAAEPDFGDTQATDSMNRKAALCPRVIYHLHRCVNDSNSPSPELER